MTSITPTDSSTAQDGVSRRRDWMRVLALAEPVELEAAWEALIPKPDVEEIRGPEAGMVMVRGRTDATGRAFNLGEATVSRATVRLSGGPLAADVVGSSYVLGTDLRRAWLAAIFDGLLLDDEQREPVLTSVIGPLRRLQSERDAAARADAGSTRVDFFTVAREHE